jgi:hypothetical protein
MSSDSDNSKKQKSAGKTSGATRRIVVGDLPPEEPPRIKGRKLTTPADLDAASSRSRVQQNPTYASPSREQAPVPVRRPERHQTRVVTEKPVKARESINVKRLVYIIAGMIVLPVFLVAFVLLISVVRRKSPTTLVKGGSTPSVAQPEPAKITTELSTPSPPSSQTESPPQEVSSDEIRAMTVQLASQISQKSGYEFAPELVDVIQARAYEYISAKALLGARQFRRDINKSFRDQGLHPLVGYALAMSRSKFDPTLTEKGIGIWQVPLSVARTQGYVGANENGAKLKVADSSAQISASYTKQLLSAFDADDFMYAIACFGMNLEDAGRLQVRLINAAPEAGDRRDIMKMIRAGVLTREQVDNLTRFFAAGIVGENPRKFGLTTSEPISSLY